MTETHEPLASVSSNIPVIITSHLERDAGQQLFPASHHTHPRGCRQQIILWNMLDHGTDVNSLARTMDCARGKAGIADLDMEAHCRLPPSRVAGKCSRLRARTRWYHSANARMTREWHEMGVVWRTARS